MSPARTESTIVRYAILFGAILIILIFYFSTYRSFVLVPGNDPNNPLGWWRWDDQRLYLRAAQAFTHGDFRASEHFYPPLYPFIGALFLPLASQHPFLVPDLAFTVAYFLVFVALFSRYVGLLASVACGLAGMGFYEPLRLQWIMPWTSTPGAFFAISALFLLDRYARLRGEPGWDARASAKNAALFGLALGFEVSNRPADAAIAAPIAVAYALLVLMSLVRAPSRKDAVAAVSGSLGVLVPLAIYVLFNTISYGSMFGHYFAANERIGFRLDLVPQELFSQLLSSSVFFGERHADWISRIPAALAAVAILPVVLFAGPLVMRIVAASAIAQFILYYSDTDILPTGTFRFCNIHYFKWLVPIAFCIVYYFIRQTLLATDRPRRQAIAVLAGGVAFELAISCVAAAPVYQPVGGVVVEGDEIDLDLSGDRIDYIDLTGVTGKWGAMYFAAGSSVTLDGARALAVVRDYRLLPIPDGVRVLFFAPVAARKIAIHLAEGMAASREPGGVEARAARVRFTVGAPFNQALSN